LVANSFVLVRVVIQILKAGTSRSRTVRFIQIAMVALAFFGGVGNAVVGVHTYHVLRILFDIIMPCFWAVLLSSPSMRQWISLNDSRYDFRCSIADLLFVTTVAAFSMVLWSMFYSWHPT